MNTVKGTQPLNTDHRLMIDLAGGDKAREVYLRQVCIDVLSEGSSAT